MKYKILIVDDEYRMRILLRDYLENEGYEVMEASNGAEALELFSTTPLLNCIILDIMMPQINGWTVLTEIRTHSNVPVIMVTAKVTEQDELNGFKLGVDDYITKPFSPPLLIARIKSILKRTETEATSLTRNALTLNLSSRNITVKDQLIELTTTEFDLLYFLVRHENQVFTRDALLNQVWGLDYFGTERTVDTTINRLRIKLVTVGNWIVTVRGYGYKFEVPYEK